MAHEKNLIGKGNRFSTTNQPANRGRKPHLYKFAKEEGVSVEEYKLAISYLFNLTTDQVRALKEAEDTPVWVGVICTALLTDIKHGRTNTVFELADRLFGKATANVDLTTNGKDVTPAYASIQVVYEGGEVLELKSEDI